MQVVVAQPVGEGQHVSVGHRHLEVFILEVNGELQEEEACQESLGRVLTGTWWSSPGRGLEGYRLASPLTSP